VACRNVIYQWRRQQAKGKLHLINQLAAAGLTGGSGASWRLEFEIGVGFCGAAAGASWRLEFEIGVGFCGAAAGASLRLEFEIGVWLCGRKKERKTTPLGLG